MAQKTKLPCNLRITCGCASLAPSSPDGPIASTKCRVLQRISNNEARPAAPKPPPAVWPCAWCFDGPPVAGFCTASGHAGPPGFLGLRLHGIGLDSRFARRDRSTMSLATQPSPRRGKCPRRPGGLGRRHATGDASGGRVSVAETKAPHTYIVGSGQKCMLGRNPSWRWSATRPSSARWREC